MKTAYRYKDQMYAQSSMDVHGNDSWYSIGPKVELQEYQIIKTTSCGFWISLDYCFGDSPGEPTPRKRWVRNSSHKKFACLTKEEALDSFIARKACQVRLLKNQLERAQMAHQIAAERKREGTF